MGARLAAEVGSFTAVEPDGRSFGVAAERIGAQGGVVVQGTIEDLPPDSVFDLVCAFEVLEHFADDAEALERWVGRVRPGGHLLISVPAWQHLYSQWDRRVGHVRRYSPDDVEAAFRSSGVDPVWVRLYGWPLAHLLEALRNRLARRASDPGDAAELTAASGRMLQPSSRLAGVGVDVGVVPFRVLQRLAPHKGNGIVALARKPA